METTTIAGVAVSRIGLGTWEIGGLDWGAVSDDVAVATCLGALERGINLIDTAPIYGDGRSEEIVGKAMRAHGRREDFYIATKAGLERNWSGVFANSTALRLRQELEASLRRLGTDFIDLYQVHWPDTRTPIAETAALLAEFEREGKVRALGVSNFSVAQMEEFRSVAPLASNQPPYNIFDRQIDEAALTGEAALPSIRSWCAANKVAILCYSPGHARHELRPQRHSQLRSQVSGAALLAVHHGRRAAGGLCPRALWEDCVGAGRPLGSGPARRQRSAVGRAPARAASRCLRRDGLEARCERHGRDRPHRGRVRHRSRRPRIPDAQGAGGGKGFMAL
jgi:aryl-alcohol dehydrogenase-like predicted oxidoreductase